MVNPFETTSEDLGRALPGIADVLNDRKSKGKGKATMPSAKHANLSEEDEQEEEAPLLHGREFKRTSKLRQSLDAVISIQAASQSTEDKLEAVIARQEQFIEWGNQLTDIVIKNQGIFERRFDRLEKLLLDDRQESTSPSKITSSPPKTTSPPSFRSASRASSLNLKGSELLQQIVVDNKFRHEDIGYFDPHLFESHGKGDFVFVGQHVYYRDVHLFIASAKAIAATKGSQIVRTHLHACLRGTAQAWYVAELSDWQRANLQSGDGITFWQEELTNRFKMRDHEALDLLQSNHYTIEDVKRKRPIASYVQSIARHERDAGFSTANQISWAWNHLASGLQRDIPKSTRDTTILSFIQQLEDMQYSWQRYYMQQTSPTKPRWESRQQWDSRQSEPPKQRWESRQQQLEYSRNQHSNQQSRFRNDYVPRSDRNQVMSPQQQQQQRLIEQAPVVPSKQPSWTKQAYHVVEEEEDAEDQQQAYYEEATQNQQFEESEPRSYMVGVNFNDAAVPKHGIAPFTCQHCPRPQSFANDMELHDHVLDYHGYDIHSFASHYRLQNANYVEHADAHVYNYAPSSSFGYANVEASIFNYDLTACLDTGGGVSLMDRSLLSNTNLYGIVHRTQPITVTEVTGKQITDEYIEEEVQLGPNKDKLHIKAYLVNRLQLGLLIGMDTLGRGDIDLNLSRNALTIAGKDISLSYASGVNSHTSYHFTVATPQGISKRGHVFATQIMTNSPSSSKRKLSAFRASKYSLNSPSQRYVSGLPLIDSSEKTLEKASHTSLPSTPACRRCHAAFPFNNHLHKHLRGGCQRRRRLDDPWRSIH